MNLHSFLSTALHVGAHMFNVENFVFSWNRKDKLTSVLNSEGGDNFVNPIRNSDGVSTPFFTNIVFKLRLPSIHLSVQ